MPTQVEKLQAHTAHLLDAFIALRQRYAMLHPMLFHPDVVTHYGSNARALGFHTLRHSLFLSCAQDIAKLSLDKDERTPSIRNLQLELLQPHVLSELKDAFTIWVLPEVDTEPDPEIQEALRRMELREQAERRAQFDEILKRTQAAWQLLESDPALKALLTVRNKVSAHTEVHLVADKYKPVDIAALGIKWGDLKRMVDCMQPIVEDLGLLIRNAGFAWDSLDVQLSKASMSFWITSPVL